VNCNNKQMCEYEILTIIGIHYLGWGSLAVACPLKQVASVHGSRPVSVSRRARGVKVGYPEKGNFITSVDVGQIFPR